MIYISGFSGRRSLRVAADERMFCLHGFTEDQKNRYRDSIVAVHRRLDEVMARRGK